VNYAIDPQTGLPLLQTPGGGGLPLPLSPEEMAAAGAQQVPPWAQQVPELPEQLRGPGPGAMASIPTGGGVYGETNMDQFASQARADAERAQILDAVNAGQAPARPPAGEHRAPPPGGVRGAADKPARSAGAIDPSELATGPAEQPQISGGQGGGMDTAVEQVFREALSRGRGGGGPARLGVTSQTAKFFQPGEVPQEVSEEAEGARLAREGFDLELADRTDMRRQQIYEARQAEAAYRMAQIEVERTRQAEQQRMLDEYAVKRDAMLEEAAQIKAPDMADYWGGKSDVAKMMTALSIAIGGALQGLRGGPNPGLEMSNQAIDRWLLTKREEYNHAKDRADFADNQYAKMVQRFGSENLATANLREQAYAVRDAMLLDYAQEMGSPPAVEAAQAMLLAEQQKRAEGKAAAYAAAGQEIEQKLSLTGGGGGGSPRLLKALGDAAQAKKYLDEINGTGQAQPTREVQTEKVETVTGSLDALTAAEAVERHLDKLGYSDRDADDPTSGLLDRAANAIPGTDTRRTVQDLEQDTFNLARGAQLSLGKSDNDARLAEQWASGGGGSGRERKRAAQSIKKKSLGKIQDTLSSLTPAQRAAFINSLPPERQQQLKEALGGVARPTAAASERAVTVE
jgi:hypothetical protein